MTQPVTVRESCMAYIYVKTTQDHGHMKDGRENQTEVFSILCEVAHY